MRLICPDLKKASFSSELLRILFGLVLTHYWSWKAENKVVRESRLYSQCWNLENMILMHRLLRTPFFSMLYNSLWNAITSTEDIRFAVQMKTWFFQYKPPLSHLVHAKFTKQNVNLYLFISVFKLASDLVSYRPKYHETRCTKAIMKFVEFVEQFRDIWTIFMKNNNRTIRLWIPNRLNVIAIETVQEYKIDRNFHCCIPILKRIWNKITWILFSWTNEILTDLEFPLCVLGKMKCDNNL